jgi:hypothetical protein
MISIDFNITQELKNIYMETLCSTKFQNGQTVQEKFEGQPIFDRYNFEDVMFMTPEKMIEFIEDIEAKKFDKEELKSIFKYDGKFQPLIADFIEKYLNPRVCYYCNIDYVNVYEEENGELKNKFTLDHFIDKGSYPYLALSFFNLVPCCSVCNSKIKGKTSFYEDEKLRYTNPYYKNFDFNNKVKFKLFLSAKCEDLHIKSKDDIEIPLKESYSTKYEKYIEVFYLNERYKAHKNIVYEMMKNAELYPESRLKELEDLTGVPFKQIRKDIFNLVDEETELSKKPFSKLIKDISEELGLV